MADFIATCSSIGWYKVIGLAIVFVLIGLMVFGNKDKNGGNGNGNSNNNNSNNNTSGGNA